MHNERFKYGTDWLLSGRNIFEQKKYELKTNTLHNKSSATCDQDICEFANCYLPKGFLCNEIFETFISELLSSVCNYSFVCLWSRLFVLDGRIRQLKTPNDGKQMPVTFIKYIKLAARIEHFIFFFAFHGGIKLSLDKE